MASHAMPQLVPLQLAAPCEGGSAQAEQREPQVATSLLGAQMPLQLCVLFGHVLLHARLLAMQAPLQSCIVEGQVVPHDNPSHVAEPPVGTGQAEHDEGPQLESRLFETHGPVPAGHWWYPLLQEMPHVPPAQRGETLGSVGHFMQLEPQALESLSAAQLVLPHA